MENFMDNKKVQIGLLVLLVLSAFYIGSLQQKVRSLQERLGQNPSQVAQGSRDQGDEIAAANTETATERMNRILGGLGIDANEFATCVTSEEAANFVKDQAATGSAVGVNGTPGNFLLDTQTRQVIEIAGAQPLTNVENAYESLLAGEGDDSIDLEGIFPSDFVRGDRNARVLLIEYSDYDCPFCIRFHNTAIQLIEKYAGQIAWIYRQFPLDSLHPDARIKSQGAYCAGKLGGNDAFWAFSDAMFLE
jgi:protein-disulfide isomerase